MVTMNVDVTKIEDYMIAETIIGITIKPGMHD
jgi:hypothetical protein